MAPASPTFPVSKTSNGGASKLRDPVVVGVPAPGAAALFAFGLGMIGVMLRRPA